MAEIHIKEKYKVEKFLNMGGGYVADFTNRSLNEFVGHVTGKDLNDSKYDYESNSKANRIRQFFKVESDEVVGTLIKELCDYSYEKQKKEVSIDWFGNRKEVDEELYKECLRAANRLIGNTVEDIDAIKANTEAIDFKVLAESIRENIGKNLPEVALDHLHTFVMKYIRELCSKHGIEYSNEEALHSIFGKYVKFLVGNGHLETEMIRRIMKSSISNLDAFNDVRNNKSYAHDNPILGYEESILIFNSVSSMIKFIESLENKINKIKEDKKTNWDDMKI